MNCMRCPEQAHLHNTGEHFSAAVTKAIETDMEDKDSIQLTFSIL